MTPAINLVKKANIVYNIHQYQHDPASQSYGLEAAEKLGLSAQQVFKTLVVESDNKELIVAIIPVCRMLNLKLIAKAANTKKAAMAAKTDVERATGFVLGGVSPLGQKKKLRTFIDKSAINFETIFVSAGKRGLEIELRPEDLAMLSHGKLATLH